MVPSPVTIAPEATLREAVALMTEHAVRHLPVTRDGKVVGLLSRRDVQVGMALHTLALIHVERAMRRKPYVVPSDTALDVVLTTMSDRRLGSAVVTNAEGRPLGIFTTVDALKLFARALRGELE